MAAGGVRRLSLIGWPLTFVVAALALAAQAPRPVRLTAGMVIDRSVVVRAGTYRIDAPAGGHPALTIRGENITVDFSGAVLAGGPDAADPETYDGVGILVDGGRDVTIKNAVVRGYKIAVLARRSPDLRVSGGDFSYNYKPRLYSGVEKESLVDWMSYHQNDKDEWLTRGAALYLAECDRAEIDRTTILQGQNGLMVTRSSGLKIWSNTIQFMSGIGVGLYRTADSTIAHNRIDFCVRGYSHGFYNRGQDSAGLLMYEQSSRNHVFHNSITHGGDGLFLWAGQSTMDSGQGGSNDNVFEDNDFSHAVTNGIEATFSRNRFEHNRVEDCWHGVWGGYSYESIWRDNSFARNTEHIAIEHGQKNRIEGNSFEGGEIGIRLWQNASQDPGWGYPKHRDTRSHRYELWDNRFIGTKTALDIRATTDVDADANRFEGVGTRLAGDVAIDTDAARGPHVITDRQLSRLSAERDPMIKDPARRGRQRIIVDEWGPYDWRAPKLWPTGRSDVNPLVLRVLGPKGQWRLRSIRGAAPSAKAGGLPGEITITPISGAVTDFDVRLEYRGEAVISPRGRRTPAGTPYAFGYSRFFVPIDWQIRFYRYDDDSDPVKAPAAFARVLAAAPITTVTANRLDYLSGRAIEEGVPADRFALEAEGTATLPPGDYTLQVISDDGVRVWMDETLVLDEWTPHESKVSRVAIRGGRRHFKVQYYDVRGFAELRFDIQRK